MPMPSATKGKGRVSGKGEGSPIDDGLAKLEAAIASNGLDVLKPSGHLGNLAKPRMLEVHAALSRLRGLSIGHTLPPKAGK